MLEKLITNLKKSLPGAKKNDEEEDVETTEEESSEEESDGESGAGSSADDEKKKKISMLIRVAVIIGLGYVAVDHFFLSAPDESIEALVAKPPKRRKKPAPVVEEKKAEEVAAIAASPADSAPATTEPVNPPTETTPPVESINILDKNEPAQAETTPPPAVEETPAALPPETKSTIGESNLDQRLDQLIDKVEKKEDPKEQTPSMEDKIVQEEAYTEPPAYNVLGRGLVYNCKDKYWACIDKPSYISCNKNLKWNTANGKTKECVVQNVYSSEEDCIKVQKYNVSVNQGTEFCQ